MSGKHTPGPWVVGRLAGREDGHGMDERAIEGEAEEIIATAWPIGEDFDTDAAPEREANARLIAAAPDLLALAQALYAHITEEAGSHSRYCNAIRGPGDETWIEADKCDCGWRALNQRYEQVLAAASGDPQ